MRPVIEAKDHDDGRSEIYIKRWAVEDDDELQKFEVEYYAGPYSGTRTVWAADADHAKVKVRAWVRKEMSMPMYADGYKVQ